MLRLAVAALGFLAAILVATEGRAERRVALVVGNAHYEHANTLRNPLNDAKDIAEVLKKLGFEVMVGTDLDQRAFASQIDAFGRMLEGADVALFFYAGHGLQMNDKNYLVSTKARLESEFLIPAETVELDAIIRLMESHTRVNLVFLDACRNNPLADKLRQSLIASNRSVSLGRGLARIEPTGHDTLIAFAAAPGQVAADGRDRNSPFTGALLEYMPKPGVEVSVMLKEVAAQVRRETQNAQRPQQLSDMSQTFYFAKADPAVASPQPAPTAAIKPAPDHSVELAYWNSARSLQNCESFRAYLDRYPNGIFADLAKLSEQGLCDASRKVTVVETEPPPVLPEKPQPPVGVAAEQSEVTAGPAQPASPSDLPGPAAATPAPSPAPAPESKVAALPQPGAPAPEPTPEVDSGSMQAELARDLQRELARVGCSAGRPDGIWGTHSRDAIREFNRHARASLDPDVPSEDALAALRRHQARVCPAPESTPSRSRPERVRTRDRSPPAPPVERERVRTRKQSPTVQRGTASTVKDWRSISPLCESAYTLPGRTCCTYDPPTGPPRIICR